jgi:hypothetical protein
MPISLNGSTGIQFPDSSLQAAAASPYTLKNKIINGDFRIDQRNAGASVSISTGANNYTIDRWQAQGTPSAGVYTVQRSTTAPSEFVNSFLATVTTADASLAAGDLYSIGQFIEGFNVADLGWGTANAKTVTISFWVRSSVTGTFGGSVGNSAFNRSYPFTYTISTANTFEYKTITIAGDTSGTWLTDNGIGIRLYFGLGASSTYSGTAGAWAGAGTVSATGATNLMATNGATWYVTGVQLEQNTTATPFERRLYNQELANCQRYYQLNTPGCGKSTSTTAMAGTVGVQTAMRDVPTATLFTGTNKAIDIGVAFRNITSLTVLEGASVYGGNITSVVATTTSGVVHTYMGGAFAFSAEL